MANIEMLNRIIAQIKAEPKLWQQDSYATETACGTAFCVAGWAAALTRPAPVVRWGMAWEFKDGAGKLGDFVDVGMEVLGLTDDQADALFASNNTLKDIEAMRDALAANPDIDGVTLAEYAMTA